MSWLRIAALLTLLHAFPAAAIESFVIKDIRIEGIQRTEAGTIFSYLPVKVGDTLTEEKAAQAIRSLFATGFFRDVSLERADRLHRDEGIQQGPAHQGDAPDRPGRRAHLRPGHTREGGTGAEAGIP